MTEFLIMINQPVHCCTASSQDFTTCSTVSLFKSVVLKVGACNTVTECMTLLGTGFICFLKAKFLSDGRQNRINLCQFKVPSHEKLWEPLV